MNQAAQIALGVLTLAGVVAASWGSLGRAFRPGGRDRDQGPPEWPTSQRPARDQADRSRPPTAHDQRPTATTGPGDDQPGLIGQTLRLAATVLGWFPQSDNPQDADAVPTTRDRSRPDGDDHPDQSATTPSGRDQAPPETTGRDHKPDATTDHQPPTSAPTPAGAPVTIIPTTDLIASMRAFTSAPLGDLRDLPRQAYALAAMNDEFSHLLTGWHQRLLADERIDPRAIAEITTIVAGYRTAAAGASTLASISSQVYRGVIETMDAGTRIPGHLVDARPGGGGAPVQPYVPEPFPPAPDPDQGENPDAEQGGEDGQPQAEPEPKRVPEPEPQPETERAAPFWRRPERDQSS